MGWSQALHMWYRHNSLYALEIPVWPFIFLLFLFVCVFFFLVVVVVDVAGQILLTQPIRALFPWHHFYVGKLKWWISYGSAHFPNGRKIHITYSRIPWWKHLWTMCLIYVVERMHFHNRTEHWSSTTTGYSEANFNSVGDFAIWLLFAYDFNFVSWWNAKIYSFDIKGELKD